MVNYRVESLYIPVLYIYACGVSIADGDGVRQKERSSTEFERNFEKCSLYFYFSAPPFSFTRALLF
jgi:hypothetical protein